VKHERSLLKKYSHM